MVNIMRGGCMLAAIFARADYGTYENRGQSFLQLTMESEHSSNTSSDPEQRSNVSAQDEIKQLRQEVDEKLDGFMQSAEASFQKRYSTQETEVERKIAEKFSLFERAMQHKFDDQKELIANVNSLETKVQGLESENKNLKLENTSMKQKFSSLENDMKMFFKGHQEEQEERFTTMNNRIAELASQVMSLETPSPLREHPNETQFQMEFDQSTEHSGSIKWDIPPGSRLWKRMHQQDANSAPVSDPAMPVASPEDLAMSFASQPQPLNSVTKNHQRLLYQNKTDRQQARDGPQFEEETKHHIIDMEAAEVARSRPHSLSESFEPTSTKRLDSTTKEIRFSDLGAVQRVLLLIARETYQVTKTDFGHMTGVDSNGRYNEDSFISYAFPAATTLALQFCVLAFLGSIVFSGRPDIPWGTGPPVWAVLAANTVVIYDVFEHITRCNLQSLHCVLNTEFSKHLYKPRSAMITAWTFMLIDAIMVLTVLVFGLGFVGNAPTRVDLILQVFALHYIFDIDVKFSGLTKNIAILKTMHVPTNVLVSRQSMKQPGWVVAQGIIYSFFLQTPMIPILGALSRYSLQPDYYEYNPSSRYVVWYVTTAFVALCMFKAYVIDPPERREKFVNMFSLGNWQDEEDSPSPRTGSPKSEFIRFGSDGRNMSSISFKGYSTLFSPSSKKKERVTVTSPVVNPRGPFQSGRQARSDENTSSSAGCGLGC